MEREMTTGRLLPKNTPIDMLLVPRAVATQAEAEEVERAAMAIRGFLMLVRRTGRQSILTT